MPSRTVQALAIITCAAGAAAWLTWPSETLSDPAAAERGRDFLFKGDYIGAGIPIELWKRVSAPLSTPLQRLDREGILPTVPDDMNQYTLPNGVEVVSGVNCIGCHASEFRGEFVIGMGNSLRDWPPAPVNYTPLATLAALTFPDQSPQANTFRTFLRGARVLNGTAATPFRGVNPAFRFEEIAAAHRNPTDLSWSDQPVYPYGTETIASDIPPWWNVKKKRSLYYNGMGHGDFARLIQQISVVMIDDAAHTERTLKPMRDLIAYIETIEPPTYPNPIDELLAARGAEIFAHRCSDCHGTYGDVETYPNKVIPASEVGTDPVYAQTIKDSGIHTWFNKSWFAQDNATYADPTVGYIAPPLDGIWASAPYFHNGSVPTVEAVLNSALRPAKWRRSFDPHDYDLNTLGWKHEPLPAGAPTHNDRSVYDTTRRGYSNAGHNYSDDLSEEDRAALLEYLKSL